jgi:molecular chaperone DnaK
VEVYSTASDNQPSVEINILQGERPMAQQNRQLGRFILSDIPPAPRGVPQIEVTFDVDANGILNVTAKDKGTGKEQKIRIEASSGLTDAEINRMREEAKANEAADKAERETVEKVNAADSMIFQTEKQLKEYGDKLSPANKTGIEDALATLRTAHSSRDAAGIDTALEALNAAWATASTEMYNATNGADANPMDGSGFDGGNANPGAGQGQPTDGNVSDVPYEEVK